MQVNYSAPAQRVKGFSLRAGLLLVALLAVAYVLFAPSMGTLFATLVASGLVFGANTVTYSWPVSGTTAPTAAVARIHQMLIATITGDNSTTSFTITHNWGLSTAELAAGFPVVISTPLLAAGYTAAQTVTSKATNTVVFGNTAFTGAGLQITLLRPWSSMR